MKRRCKIIHSIFLIFFIINMNNIVFAQDSKIDVYFYGVITPSFQDNQKGITQDLFAAQIRINPELNFIDKRNAGLSENYSNLSDKKIKSLTQDSIFELIPINETSVKDKDLIIFFAKTDKIDDETWNCSFYAKNLLNSKVIVKSENFQSYYKLLAEARTSITQILSEITGLHFTITQSTRPKPAKDADTSMTIESISGTWTGENDITKVILLRSGRGFVIFSNGASMNIGVNIVETDNNHRILKITQNANFNASFYPNIPRQKVLEFAPHVTPIEWTFILTEDGNLDGFKKSLGIDSDEKVFEERTKVIWKKQN